MNNNQNLIIHNLSFFRKIFFTVLLFSWTYSSSLFSSTEEIALFFNHNKPSKELISLFEQLENPITTLQEANAFSQKHLLRSGQPWDQQSETAVRKLMQMKKEALIENLTELHLIKKIDPLQKEYSYALLMGATKKACEKRIAYLSSLCEKGYIFDYIVLLGGQRLLEDFEKKELPQNISTEAEMMMFLCKSHPLLKEKQILLIDAPLTKKPNGTMAQPNTEDTLVLFTQKAPKKGTCLVISHNPYIVRQTMIAQRILNPLEFTVHGAGVEYNSAVNVVILMDEFARTLYEVCKQVSIA